MMYDDEADRLIERFRQRRVWADFLGRVGIFLIFVFCLALGLWWDLTLLFAIFGEGT